MSATSRVLLGLFAAAAIGLTLTWVDPPLAIAVADVVSPLGRLWLNALQMTVVPLVLSLVCRFCCSASPPASRSPRREPTRTHRGTFLQRR